VAATGTAINLEGANDAHEAGIDLLLAAFGQQHLGGQLAPGKAAPEGFAHHVRVPAQSLATVLPAAHHRVKVLIPEKGELTELVQTTLDQSSDEIEIDLRTAVADLAVLIQVEDADVGQKVARVLVKGTISTVGSETVARSSCTMTAGRMPAWVCPGTEGRRTRQTSPLFIDFALLGQAFDQLQRFGARQLPGVQFFLQLRWDFDRSVDQPDLHERSFGQWRVWDDDAVLDETGNGDRHGLALLNYQRGL
jgi:hypothetical protein